MHQETAPHNFKTTCIGIFVLERGANMSGDLVHIKYKNSGNNSLNCRFPMSSSYEMGVMVRSLQLLRTSPPICEESSPIFRYR
ncbi:hypothetical protein ANN_23058 [Periplaneta americana]|uniref:Uncharacterized protein n=1 Tax=Periplaneta americana TaxID=6978 RepID=A0ABQ8SLA0_PERAM|nr:hypothetical protein ANN_23058 [Periplaneta americana]